MKINEEDIVKKIDAGEELSEKELKFLIWDCNRVDEQIGAPRRWMQSVESVVEINGRFFMIPWDRGLTELQEDEFWYQPFEVTKHEYEKTVKVIEWIRKE